MSISDIHKYGTDDGWHGVIKPDGQFEPVAGRYHMYIGACHLTI
jgi:putative glutathione S-transferase